MELPPVIAPPRQGRSTGRTIIWILLAISLPVAGALAWIILQSGGVDHSNVSFDAAPDGRSIVFSSASGDLYLYTLGGRKASRLVHTPKLTNSDPEFSPDGKFVVYSRSDEKIESSALFILPTAGGQPRQLTKSAGL